MFLHFCNTRVGQSVEGVATQTQYPEERSGVEAIPGLSPWGYRFGSGSVMAAALLHLSSNMQEGGQSGASAL